MKRFTSIIRVNLFITLFTFFNINIRGQTHSIILGRPTDVSITASILFDYKVNFYLEYGTSSGVYNNKTSVMDNVARIPDEVDILSLMPDTKYYYRLQYRADGSATYTTTEEYSFRTQRSKGSTFTFTVEADEHLYDKKGVDNMYRVTLENQKLDQPDFMITLGDIFGDDHTPSTTTLADMEQLHNSYRPFLGNICHSVPFYVCLGNHEGENDYYLSLSPPDNIGVYGTLMRKKYYPNPFPNHFYSGDTVNENFGINLPENYYSWIWGDALFVVLDVYRTECKDSLSPKPQGWNWTLGEKQYFWLLNTLKASTAKFKFVFAHHLRGQGRGAVLLAPLFEWGGYQNAGGNYTFKTQRPGWPMPIHEMFKTYGVNIFFQGHDHLFAREQLDGITYQEVPMAADSTYQIGVLANANAYTSDTLDGTGHLRVTVSPNCVNVDYIRAYLPKDTLNGAHKNKEIAFSYSLGSCTTAVNDAIRENNFLVYPNPACDMIFIRPSETSMKFKAYLINAVGQIAAETNSSSLNVANIKDGLYFLHVYSPTIDFTKKIMISR